SADGGQTWPVVATAPGQMTVLYFDPAGHAFGGTWSGLYRSADSGTTWTLVGMSGLRIGAVTQTADGTSYAGAGHALYRSSDDCRTWQLFAILPADTHAKTDRPQR